jgi:hypothetical protein
MQVESAIIINIGLILRSSDLYVQNLSHDQHAGDLHDERRSD